MRIEAGRQQERKQRKTSGENRTDHHQTAAEETAEAMLAHGPLHAHRAENPYHWRDPEPWIQHVAGKPAAAHRYLFQQRVGRTIHDHWPCDGKARYAISQPDAGTYEGDR